MSSKVLYAHFPLMYLYVTRLEKPFKVIQWIGGDFIFVFLLVISFNNTSTYNPLSLFLLDSNTAIWLVAKAILYFYIFITFFTLYELGYVVNDCISTRKESNPTIRFQSCEYWKTIAMSKIVSFILLTAALYWLFKLDVNTFLLYSTLTVSFFLFLHNNVFTEDRSISYFWLQYLRLMIVPFTVIANAYVLFLLSFAILPEVLRRTLRYLRIKLQHKERKFNVFDLKVFVISSFFVMLGFFRLSVNYVYALFVPYALIVGGILISLILQE